MNLLQQATQAMIDLHSLTSSLKHGSTPDVYSILGIQSDLVKYHLLIGEEMSAQFGLKEKTYLNRKIQEANEYRKGRLDLKKKIADVTVDALLAVGEEQQREIESAEMYERYKMFLKSISNALDHSRQTVSFLKTTESNPSTL